MTDHLPNACHTITKTPDEPKKQDDAAAGGFPRLVINAKDTRGIRGTRKGSTLLEFAAKCVGGIVAGAIAGMLISWFALVAAKNGQSNALTELPMYRTWGIPGGAVVGAVFGFFSALFGR